LADRWIADVAFPSFRDSARVTPVPTVADWFEAGIHAYCEGTPCGARHVIHHIVNHESLGLESLSP